MTCTRSKRLRGALLLWVRVAIAKSRLLTLAQEQAACGSNINRVVMET